MNRPIRVILPLCLALVLVTAWLGLAAGISRAQRSASTAGEHRAFLPSIRHLSFVRQYASPAGSYMCLEYEFGLIWSSEIITLNHDGTSRYAYGPPAYDTIVTGTWVYSPGIHRVEFTSFRWTTATYEYPDSMSAREYLVGPEFYIALSCLRR